MASLFPEHSSWLLVGDGARTVRNVEALAQSMLVNECADLDLTWFELQVFLCEYKQALRGKKYPGRSHDSELGYWHRTRAHFGLRGTSDDVLTARAEAFPHEVLGELQGWEGVRPECERTMLDNGYMWTDLRMDYMATKAKGDFSKPVMRNE